ncbi:MAG: NAD-dependent epimerase/dehydratase family protein, partial [Bryobacteraceae bacterium]
MRIGTFFSGLPVLVTGATGFIGSHLAQRLVGLGARVRCLVRRTSRTGVLPAGIELAQGELATGEGLAEAVRGAQLVFHLAGVTKAVSPADYERGNVLATRNLVGALESCEARLVQVSSLAAVGPSSDGSPLPEDCEPRPVSLYGRSKLEAERAVLCSGLAARAVIVRPPVVFGPRDTDVYQLLRMAARGWLPVTGGPEARFSVIYVEDLVEGLLAAACHESAAGRTYF